MFKKMFTAVAVAIVFMSCGGSDANKESAGPEEKEVSADVTSSPVYKEGLELVSNNDCLTCHKVNEKLNGPAYSDVAAKYADAADTTVSRLAKTIINGGSGHWGTLQMTAHSNLSQEDAEKMVRYILLLKK